MLRRRSSEPLVGRQRELDIASDLLASASQGVPQLLVLSGEAGIGKTRLARAISAHARSRGVRTLWGAGQEDLSLPYLPLTMALGPLHDDGPWLLGRATPPSDPAADPTRSWGEVAEILLAAARRPVVLVVDDLQWVDPASQALLMHLLVVLDHASSTRPVQLLTIVTVRTPVTDPRVGRTLSRLEREPHTVALELGGLDRAEIRDLLATLSPAPASASLLQQVMESTSGSPLLAQSIVRRGMRDGRLTLAGGTLMPALIDPLRVSPDELDRSVIDALELVSQPCRDLLTVAAFLGDHHRIVDVAEVAGVEPAAADALVEKAIDAGLLHDLTNRCAFASSQVRHVLFHAPNLRARQRIHLRIADTLEARGDETEAIAIAHHLGRAGDAVARSRVARWAGHAARRAMSLGAWADAGIAAEQALAAAPPDASWEDLAELHLLLTDAASRDFDLGTAHRHGTAAIELARTHGDEIRWGRAVGRLARTLVTNAGEPGLGSSPTQLIGDYLRSNQAADPSMRAELLSLLAEIWAAAGQTDEAVEAAADARALVDDETPPLVAAAVWVAEGLVRWTRLELVASAEAYERAMQSGTDLPGASPAMYAAVRHNLVDHLAGQVDRAGASVATLLPRLAGAQVWGEHALAAAGATSLALVRGQFDDVERLGAMAELAMSRSAYLEPTAIALPAMALGRALRGDGSGARAAIHRMGAGPGTTARYEIAIDALLGDTERVSRALRERAWRPPDPEPEMRDLPSAVLFAEVATALDDPDMASAALAPLMAARRKGVVLSQGWAVLITRLIADCLAVVDELREADEWLAVAADEAITGGLTVEAARVSLSRARRTARDELAPEHLRHQHATDAAHALDALGALPLAAAARRLARADAQITGPARRAILFTDLVDSTSLNVRGGDQTYLELMREHNEIIRACLHRHGGVEFKHTGDGIAAWFAAPGDAVSSAVAIGHGLERASVRHPELPLLVRSGISIGEPLGDQGDLFGRSVIHAARLCALAAGGEVLVSSEVADAVRPSGVSLRPRGPQVLKGFPEPVEVHAVVSDVVDSRR